MTTKIDRLVSEVIQRLPPGQLHKNNVDFFIQDGVSLSVHLTKQCKIETFSLRYRSPEGYLSVNYEGESVIVDSDKIESKEDEEQLKNLYGLYSSFFEEKEHPLHWYVDRII